MGDLEGRRGEEGGEGGGGGGRRFLRISLFKATNSPTYYVSR